MLTIIRAFFILIFTGTYGDILLYNTDNNQTIEKFDCVYFMYDHGEEIPYCRRLNETQQLDRNRSQCENEGVKLSFLNLLEEGIKPSNVLDWSSSVEINDLYAAFFFNRSLIENHNDPFICNCTMLGTFGKYCEYQWTNEAKSFSDAIKTQFEIKEADEDHLWNTQRYGKILCYETLPCNTGDLCLDWREICDGVQRCSSGIDEENWDKLEFNECEDNEFRCTNGMCIAEEFWLDGDHDCMDWSDEVFREQGETCPFDADSFKCDEHLCPYTMYSCGDGQCVLWTSRMAFQRFAETSDNCLSGRNLNYMCEANPYRSAWTLESGLCSVDEGYDDPRYLPWNMIDSSRLTENEKCQYLFRCTLSDGFERDCPCNSHNCTALMMKVCPKNSQYSHHVLYPPKGLIDGNLLFFHDFNRSGESLNVEPLVFFYGNIKCPGYQLITNTPVGVDFIPDVLLNPRINHELCNWRLSSEGLIDSSSSFQYDKFCWNESLTFNGQPYAVNPDACPYERQCISQYRIRDGSDDCLVYEDEEIDTESNYCTGNVGRYRFQCFNDEHQCLSLFFIGTGFAQCSNEYDESWYGLDHSFLRTRMCYRGDTRDCDRWKEYIQQSSSKNSSNNTLLDISKQNTSSDRISFRSYCDSFWDLEGHLDELNSSCQHWTCQSHQYQCQTGQCINFAWVCDGEWDCADASDEEAIVLIQKWSIHNSRFEDLNERVEKCRTRYFQSTFSEICNTSFEFGCYQAKVANPLDIRLYRPCINLTQIGDGVENCYNAYDEKNTFAVNSEQMTMLGFHFTCKNNTFPYTDGCDSVKENNCTEILCPNHRNDLGRCSGIKDVRCLESDQCERNARCNGERDCIHGEDEYWCASGTIHDQVFYRSRKRMSSIRDIEQVVFDSKFPLAPITLSDNEQAGVTPINHTENPFRIMHSYQCNRGVSILQMNETICLCPPAYYGRWCEFFSDRISIIVKFDQKTLPTMLVNTTLKVICTLQFNRVTVDSHEFHIIPTIENLIQMKHKFYLLYSRSDYMLAHKRWRYFNRTDIIHNHPYSVRFDLFSLGKNSTIKEVGSWYYPVYFDYLPAFRLAVVLKYPSWLENATLNPCASNNCMENATCIPVLNQNNSYYCSCRSGYYGEECSLYESTCDSYCSVNSLCRRADANSQGRKVNLYCVCSLDHFGPRCYLKFDGCDSNPCLNNGTCSLTMDRSATASYMCACSQQFYGNRCEQEKPAVRVTLNMNNTSFVRGTVVQLYRVERLTLVIQHAKVHHGLPSTVYYEHSNRYAPYIGVLKMYEDFANPKYLIMYVLHQRVINITSSPKYCPQALLLLSELSDRSVPMIFRYHHLCQNDTDRFCFHDENYLCICESNNSRAECFNHNPQLDHCDNCLSGGRCLQGDQIDLNDFICLCPSCHQGHRCEFNLQPFGFTLDSLLVGYTKEVKIISVVLAFVIFSIGLYNNLCSFVTFKRPKPRKFTVGNYLLIVTCLNQVALLCLLLKFAQISFGLSYIGTCKVITFLFSVFTRSTYWLTSWITVDRFLIILYPTSLSLKNARRAIWISIGTFMILLGMHVHEIAYYTSIEHLPTGSFICVINLDTFTVSIYNRISTLIHYILPFIIQILSITFMIVLAAYSRVKTTGKKSTLDQILKKQFQNQKELYITPIIIVLSGLPQIILTFSMACTQLTNWQQHTLLGAYLLSYAPQVLGFVLHVLPSTSYKKEFDSTYLGKILLNMKK